MKKVLISIFIIMFIISMVTIVNAASGTISTQISENRVQKGSLFTVTIKGAADEPIDGFYTKMNYDSTVLNLENQEIAENYSNNSGENEIFLTSNSSSDSPTNVILDTLTFKVLESTTAESATISFSNSELQLKVGDSIQSDSTQLDDVIITVISNDTIDDGDEDQPSNQDTVIPGTDDSTSPSSQDDNTPSSANIPANYIDNSGDKSSIEDDSAKESGKLPQTGAEVATFAAIATVSVISVISFVSYKKYKNI